MVIFWLLIELIFWLLTEKLGDFSRSSGQPGGGDKCTSLQYFRIHDQRKKVYNTGLWIGIDKTTSELLTIVIWGWVAYR